MQSELHQWEIRSTVKCNCMQNDNMCSGPVGIVSYSDCTDTSTIENADDAGISLLFLYCFILFQCPPTCVYEPKSLAGPNIIIKNISLIKMVED
jgi:hypothetical protein